MNTAKIEALLEERKSLKYKTPYGVFYEHFTNAYLKIEPKNNFNKQMDKKVEEFWDVSKLYMTFVIFDISIVFPI